MGTKNNPGAFDCYANALPDEPMFVLLARDPDAADLVGEWAFRRLRRIEAGEKPPADKEMVSEALDCRDAMRGWREANDGAWRKPGAALSVTAEYYPALHKSFEDISHDSGGSAGWEAYPVPAKWMPMLPMAEGALAGLSDDDRSVICIGDAEEARKIIARSPELGIAYAVLNAFFDNPAWPHPSEIGDADRCPKCNSPQPHLHPAVQNEGEVHTCEHPWHQRQTPENR